MIECLKMHKENFDYCLGEIIRESEEKDKEIERLHSIIKEVREWILFQQEHSMESYIATDMLDDILEILDKENE